MVCSFSSSVYLALATILLASAVHATAGTVDLCKAARFQHLCSQVVKKITNAVTATEAAINASIKETKNAKQEANRLGKENVCSMMFDDAIKNLERALTDIKGNDKDSLNSDLSAAMSYYGTCDDNYTISGGTSPLANTTAKLQQMISNCLALADQIDLRTTKQA